MRVKMVFVSVKLCFHQHLFFFSLSKIGKDAKMKPGFLEGFLL